MQTVEYWGEGCKVETMITETPHKVSNKARTVFTRGQCHALALMLHEETGFPLCGLYSTSAYDPIDDCYYGTPKHIVIELPNGDLFDINGPGAGLRGENYGYPYRKRHTREEVLDFENRDYMPPNMEAARPFAKLLLQKYGIKKFTPEV